MSEITEAGSSPTHNDGEEENPMTLDDFIEEETKLVKDAIAVLGSSDDKNCTYNLGYVGRQALYACVSCAPQPHSQPAGLCLACSYHCHEGHDLIELYTKRLFRCDCGNSKFSGKKCNLEPNKSELNENNSYNQNFKGVYCTCSRPYPDPEDDTPDEMIQCIICEDWYHTRHLLPDLKENTLNSNYAEMICNGCSSRLPFLKYYSGLTVSPITKNDCPENSTNEINIDQVPSESAVVQNGPPITSEGKENPAEGDAKTNGEAGDTNPLTESAPSDATTNNVEEKPLVNGSSSNSPEYCLLKKMKPLNDSYQEGQATFWPGNFRASLCACESCKRMYCELAVPWLTDETDTVQWYEEEGLQKAESSASAHPEGLLNSELAKFNRVQQVELIQNYNDFKSSLSEFLGKFAQEKKIVRKEDIDGFFEDMQAKKRRKLDTTPPYSCR